MGRWLLIGLVVIIGGVAAYYGLRSKPAFDLDTLDSQVRSLSVGHRVAKRVADTDSIPAWLREDAAHVGQVEAILTAHTDDCEETTAKLRAHHESLQQKLAADPDRMTIARIESLTPAKRRKVAQQIVYLLAPIYEQLQPVVEEWAWECKAESEVLGLVLGTVAP